jgi:hypothetical protein
MVIAPLPLMMVMTAPDVSGQAGGGAMYDWPEGTTAEYVITRGEVQTLEVPGRESTPSESSTDIHVTVTALGPRQFSLNFTDVTTTSVSLDVAALIGSSCRITLDDRGLITELTGLDGNAFVAARGGEELFREDMQLLFLYMPENGLAPGREWVREHSLTADQGEFEMERAFTDEYRCVEAVTSDGIPAMKVNQKSNARFSGTGYQSGTELEIELTGTIDSVIHVERETGMLLQLSGTGRFGGALTAQGMDYSMILEPFVAIRKVG